MVMFLVQLRSLDWAKCFGVEGIGMVVVPVVVSLLGPGTPPYHRRHGVFIVRHSSAEMIFCFLALAGWYC